jgi:hypothetical protein
VRELLSNCPPDSLVHELFKRIEDNAAPIFQTFDVSEFVGDDEEPEEE